MFHTALSCSNNNVCVRMDKYLLPNDCYYWGMGHGYIVTHDEENKVNEIL